MELNRLHEHVAGAAGRIVDLHAGFGLANTGQDGAHLGRTVVFPGALATAPGNMRMRNPKLLPAPRTVHAAKRIQDRRELSGFGAEERAMVGEQSVAEG